MKPVFDFTRQSPRTRRWLTVLALLLTALSLSAVAQDTDADADAETGQAQTPPPLYRVEVIAFVHQQGRPDAFHTDELRDFDDLLDPTALSEAQRRARQTARQFSRLHPAENLPPGGFDEPRPGDLPQPWIAIDELSSTMQRALRRLEDSGAYRPVAWRVWFQPAERGARAPRVRFYDDRIVDTLRPELVDPGLVEPQTGPRVFGDTERPDDSDRLRQVQAEPVHRYRLDGSLRLHQRQFLHLELDLEWREPAATLARPRDRVGPGFDRDPDDSRDWQIHRLTDSRIVRTGRLEYFDSAWLGVLAHIERFEQPEIEPAPEPEPGPEIESQE